MQFAWWVCYVVLGGYDPVFIGIVVGTVNGKRIQEKTALFRATNYRLKDTHSGVHLPNYMVPQNRRPQTDPRRESMNTSVICIGTQNIAQYMKHHRLKFHRNISDTPVSFYG